MRRAADMLFLTHSRSHKRAATDSSVTAHSPLTHITHTLTLSATIMPPTSSPRVNASRVLLPAILCFAFLSPLSLSAAARTCQSCSSLSLAAKLWRAVFGSAATVTGPLYVTSPVVYDLSAQQVVGGIFVNVTGAIYVADLGTDHSGSKIAATAAPSSTPRTTRCCQAFSCTATAKLAPSQATNQSACLVSTRRW